MGHQTTIPEVHGCLHYVPNYVSWSETLRSQKRAKAKSGVKVCIKNTVRDKVLDIRAITLSQGNGKVKVIKWQSWLLLILELEKVDDQPYIRH